MSTRGMRRTTWAAGLLAALAVVWPAPVAAHCDGMDGPVVGAARTALATGDPAPALAWVRPEDEGEIREAFRRTLAARGAGGEARELADLWFFETLVRVHRRGEGAPYTGLKPAGAAVEPAVAAADDALHGDGVAELAAQVAEAAADGVRARYERVKALEGHDPADVDAGRRWVEAYVDYVHFVEALSGVIHGGGEVHGQGEIHGGAAPHGTDDAHGPGGPADGPEPNGGAGA